MASTDPEGQPSKKGRTRKWDDEFPLQKPTYSAAVAGSSFEAAPASVQAWVEEDPITVEEGDITTEMGERGPRLWLSQAFKTRLDLQWEQAVIVKLMGRRVGFRTLCSRLHSLWRPRGALKVIDLDHEFYLVKLKEADDYRRMLSAGPWMIFGHVLAVQRWYPSFRPTQGQVTRAVAWVRFPNLPISRYHPTILEALGNMVGSLVKIDDATSLAQRGRFARLAVELDLSAPLRSSVDVDGESVLVEYEGLPMVCSGCGFTGHDNVVCPQRPSAPSAAPASSREDAAGPSAATARGEQPWIPVQRRVARPATQRAGGRGQARPRTPAPQPPSHSTHPGPPHRPVNHRVGHPGTDTRVGGSRFSVLETVGAMSEAPSTLPLPSHQFIFSGSGNSEGPTRVVRPELNGTSFGPILTGVPTPQTGSSSPKGPAHGPPLSRPGGPSDQAYVDRANGHEPSQLTPPSIRIQPSDSDKHLAIELQSHTEMVCDQGLLASPSSGVPAVSPLLEGLADSDLGAEPYTPIPPSPSVYPRRLHHRLTFQSRTGMWPCPRPS
ncbi:hypothetical protein K2173_003553 [Erythroxylum novogranatense]|uniref:DUF4283 domain-containing protein n=1 Tax=Erythroxylum novogranatense TaxID=1862640 RepID=A0AAV8TBP3_9ROSI|nr:hypothetical protein K2173_003553 [Erythroxylum novogranatense]